MNKVKLYYERGTVVVRGSVAVPNARFDERIRAFRAFAMYYRDIVEFLRSSGIEFVDNVLKTEKPKLRHHGYKLRSYQKECVEKWFLSGKRGIVVLPTGAGKTVVALEIIYRLKCSTLVVVPTIDLLEQWFKILKRISDDVGRYGGGYKEIKPITVATYDSAYLNVQDFGNRFELAVFDEVHHLPAPSYVSIAEMLASPYRLGLTATLEREDRKHVDLYRLVGGKVYEAMIDELKGKYLSEYDVKVVRVKLSKEEKKIYNELRERYINFLEKYNLKMPEDFEKLIMLSARDREAREALIARNRARKIAFCAERKLEKLREILKNHKNDRIIIFTEHNDIVYEISRRFLIPFITHKTNKAERREVLEKFKRGIYKAIVTSKVLDEGIDVPEANVGVIISGSGSKREFRQRLGRLLRKKEDKRAILYEIVSIGTSETFTHKKRHRS